MTAETNMARMVVNRLVSVDGVLLELAETEPSGTHNVYLHFTNTTQHTFIFWLTSSGTVLEDPSDLNLLVVHPNFVDE